jgi:uncharacterized protein (TIGR00369 family)
MNIKTYFRQLLNGEGTPPPCAQTLGAVIKRLDDQQGTSEIEFDGKAEFANPAGTIQGGFLAAMLDDTMGPALVFMLEDGEFAPTLNLNVSFLRAAKVGKIVGKGRVVRRGKEVCFLAGELFQEGRLVATATATVTIRKL